MNRSFLFATLVFLTFHASDAGELIRDPQFVRGFTAYETLPGKHIRYGELTGFATNEPPVWGLLQWSSKYPLTPNPVSETSTALVWSNIAKGVVLERSSLTLAANSAVEYGVKARTAKDPWIHLLVEQEFTQPAWLSKLKEARLHLEVRLTKSTNLHGGDYDPNVHAAQFQLFFTVQNRNKASKGFGDLLWFGVPIYDNRHRFAQAFKARDFGGTAKFIFTPSGNIYTDRSTHDGSWVVIDKDLLPLMREALETAWASGFLKGSKDIKDYAIGGMNMGWELPGSFDVEMQIRNLSLKATEAVR